jgi:hypothetical protein
MASPPKWINEEAVLDLITREYTLEKIWAVINGEDRLHLRGPVQMLRDLATTLTSGQGISPSKDSVHLGILLRAYLDYREPEERGRRKKSKELRRAERRTVSLMPEAELLCASVIDFLKSRYPEQPVEKQIKPLAIKWTVAKFNEFFEVEITETELRSYMGRSNPNSRRLTPRPR